MKNLHLRMDAGLHHVLLGRLSLSYISPKRSIRVAVNDESLFRVIDEASTIEISKQYNNKIQKKYPNITPYHERTTSLSIGIQVQRSAADEPCRQP